VPGTKISRLHCDVVCYYCVVLRASMLWESAEYNYIILLIAAKFQNMKQQLVGGKHPLI
jgi:hypothetical protein